MTAPSPEVRALAAAVAEVLDIPRPGDHTAQGKEQHRQVLMLRAQYVQLHVKDVAEDRSPWKMTDLVANIRGAAERFPIEYSTERPAEMSA